MIWLNEKIVDFAQFPNGETKMNESQIRHYLLNHTSHIHNVTFKYVDDSDLIKLMFLKNYLDSLQVDLDLIIYYMPYSRMDRSENGSAFILKYVSNFINSLYFNTVAVIEPHSDVTSALLNNCKVDFPSVKIFHEVEDRIRFDKDLDYVYYPDVTANKKYSGKIGKGYKELIGLKKRDFETGNILGLDIIGEVNKSGFKVIMIDDLSSKGTTFFKGAEKLRELGASEIYLIVGHCEDTIYEGDVLKSDLINKVFTTQTILNNISSDKIKIFPIESDKADKDDEYQRRYERHCV